MSILSPLFGRCTSWLALVQNTHFLSAYSRARNPAANARRTRRYIVHRSRQPVSFPQLFIDATLLLDTFFRGTTTYLGTMSLKSSIFMRPAGVSPILTSMKTIGRVVFVEFEDMLRRWLRDDTLRAENREQIYRWWLNEAGRRRRQWRRCQKRPRRANKHEQTTLCCTQRGPPATLLISFYYVLLLASPSIWLARRRSHQVRRGPRRRAPVRA